MLPIVMEILAYAPQAIKLGIDLTETIEKALALYNQPTAATPEQLAELQTAISAEKAKLDSMSAELDKDPTLTT